MAVGIYWKNSWGAYDLDLSSLNVEGKIGWNREFRNDDDSLMFSGDITNAPNGAVEYLYAKRGISCPTLVLNNVYNGEDECKYNIIVGRGDSITKKYMMNPNNLFLEANVPRVSSGPGVSLKLDTIIDRESGRLQN